MAPRRRPDHALEPRALIATTDVPTPEIKRGRRAVGDCGRVMGLRSYATRGSYTVLVAGDSTRSTPTVRAMFTRGTGATHDPVETCKSAGVWGSDLRAAIAAAATP